MHTSVRISSRILACCLLAATSTFALSQQAAAPAKPAPGTPVPPAQVYGKLLASMEKEFVGAAEAMPDDKFNFAPTTAIGEFKDVRTFADQVKHVAEANYYFFGGTSLSEADLKAKGDTIKKLTSKAEIVQALKDSFTQAHTFVDGITAENAFITMPNGGTRGGMAAFGLAHCMDHYGQMVEYLRMNGIVPPASRGGN
jgi:uncharacterized damage-inducible protein DinB